MKCPRCKLESPNGAVRCDCGYEFDPDAAQGFGKVPCEVRPSAILLTMGWVFALLGGVVGIMISNGIALFAISLVMSCAWIVFYIMHRAHIF